MRSLALVVLMAAPLAAGDRDRDGISDRQERRLLEKFRPRFLISRTDCDSMPAEIEKEQKHPTVREKNGAIYGQAFPVSIGGEAFVEIHYFHLWSRDCGRLGHAWDVEQVSALTRSGEAAFWVTSAHQNTICSAAQGAAAALLQAVDKGPTVWISHGKHASFFSETACRKGCGGDRCDAMIEAPRGPLINLGEPQAPVAAWVLSGAWPLRRKMSTAFSHELISRLAKSSRLMAYYPELVPVHATIYGGNAALDSMALGAAETDASLTLATGKVGEALTLSVRKLGRSLRRSRQWLEQRTAR